MEFKVGDYLEIAIPDGYFHGEYTSRIVLLDQQQLVITAPRMGGTIVSFRNGQIIRVSVPKQDARYNFEATVTAFDESKSDLVTLNIDSTAIRQQHRSDVRLTMRLPVELLYFYRQDTPVAAYTVYSIDLSAGGIKLEMPDDYPPHTHFKLAIHLPDEEITVRATVIRSGLLPTVDLGGNPSFWVSLKFLNISVTKQQKILKFIYKQQELRVKGLI